MAAVSPAANSALDAALHPKAAPRGPHRAACRTRPGQEVFRCLVTVLFLWWGSYAGAGTPLAVGVQVTMCTSSPPPRLITRDLMLVAGRSAVRQVRGVAPSTSWVTLCASAKAS